MKRFFKFKLPRRTGGFSPVFRLAVFLALFVPACVQPGIGSYQSGASAEKPLLAENTRKSIAYQGIKRNPVIVLHGFLGARLADSVTGEEVWGTFGTGEIPLERLRRLALPMAPGKALSELRGTTAACSVLDSVSVRVGGFPFSMRGYGELLGILKEAGYVPEEMQTEGKCVSLFTFFYDWRRDIAENAARLHNFLLEKRRFLRNEYERLYGVRDYDVRFDLVAHSMGGLLARYYLRCGPADLPEKPPAHFSWAGAAHVDKLIQIGTPNGGYLDTLEELIHGLLLAPGAGRYPPEVIGTFPAYYQMLPHPAFRAVRIRRPDGSFFHPDLFDAEVWKKYSWGLAGKTDPALLKVLLPDLPNDSARKAAAFDHLKKVLARAKSFSALMSVPDGPDRPPFLQILFAGDAIPTSWRATFDELSGNFSIDSYDAGDGKIPAVSARFDLRDPDSGAWSPFLDSPVSWDAIVHLRGAHMGIIHMEDFAHNVRFYLLQFPAVRAKEGRITGEGSSGTKPGFRAK